MKKSFYLFSDGEFKRKENTLFFESEKGKRFIPVEEVGEIYVFGEVDLNKRLLDLLSQKEITMHFFNYYGYYIGSFYPREHINSGYLLLKQAEHYLNPEQRLLIAKTFVSGASRNIQQVLRYYINRGKEVQPYYEHILELDARIGSVREINEAMALEGNIRDVYYRSFDVIIGDPDFVFEKRTRRPPLNYLNTLISFGNSLLYTITLSEIYKTHLDPRIGYLHSTNFRRFSLNLDLAEIFKPLIVDRLIFMLVNKRMITKSDFDSRFAGITLNENGRKTFVSELEKKLATTVNHRHLGRNVSYRSLIRLEAYKLEKHLLEEKLYEPFIAKW